jgi:hypothetical protein
MTDLLFDNKTLLNSIPDGLKLPLLEAYNEIQKNYRESRWEPSELNGGKLCEIIYTIIKGYADGSYPIRPSKPRNMVLACQNMEAENPSLSRSIRIQIPRMIIALYEIRNNRGVGHSGGDVNPNHMDANAVLYMSKWLMSELVRIFHNVDTTQASEIIDSIVERKFSLVWEVNGIKRILDESLTMKDKTLILLYHSKNSVNEKDLIEWLEHSNPSVLRRDVLRKLHKDKFIEFDETNHTLHLSPKGVRYVEESIQLEI